MASDKLVFTVEVDATSGDATFKRIGATMDDAGKKGKTAGDMISSSWDTAKGVLTAFGITATATAAAMTFKEAIGDSLTFQQKLSDVQTLLVGTGISAKDLGSKLLDLGGEFGDSAGLADALYESLSAGVEPAKAIDFVTTATKLAKAELFEAGDSAKLLATVMNAYGREITDVNHISDVFVDTINVGIVRGGELAHALGNVIPTAAQAGVSIEEVSAAVAVMTRTGIDADTATTSLNRAILSFIAPSKEASKEAAKLGIELNANVLRQKGLKDAIAGVVEATKGDIEAQAHLFGDIRGFRAALALTGAQAEDFGSILDHMRTSTGQLTTAFTIQQENIKTQWSIAVANAERVLDKFMMTSSGPVLDALKAVNEAFADGSAPVGALTAAVITLTVAMAAAKFSAYGTAIVDAFGALTILTAVKNLTDLRVAMEMFSSASGIGKLLTGTVASAAALGAMAYEVYEVYKGISDLIEAQGRLAVAQANEQASANKSVDALHKLGVAIDISKMSEVERTQALATAGKAYVDHVQQIKAVVAANSDATDSADKHAKAVMEDEAAAKKLREEIDRLKTSVVGNDLKTRALSQAIQELRTANVPAVDIVAKLGKELISTAAALTSQKVAIDPIIKVWADYAMQQEMSAVGARIASDMSKQLTKDTTTLGDGIKEATGRSWELGSATAHLAAMGKDATAADVANAVAQTLLNSALEESLESAYEAAAVQGMIADAIRNVIPWLKAQGDEIFSLSERIGGATDKWAAFRAILGQPMPPMAVNMNAGTGVVPNIDADAANAKRVLTEGQGIVDGIANNIQKMFTDMIGHGKSFWESFKSLGTATIASIASEFLKVMTHSFLDPLAKTFGQWSESVTKWLQGNKLTVGLAAGGAAIGGAVGGTTGAIAGGAAGMAIGELVKGDWVGAAIAGAVAVGATIAGLFGSLRQQADKFVQQIQNPFAEAIGEVSTALQAAKAQGTLTVTQVETASKTVADLWANFQAQAAGAGVVGQQALASLTPFMKKVMDDISGLSEVARTMQLNAAALDISKSIGLNRDALDAMVLALTNMHDAGVPTQLILEGLGGRIDDFAHVLTASGEEIPPIITLYQQLAAQAKEVADAQKRLPELEKELADVREQTANAFVAKLEFLEKAISDSNKAVEDWRKQIKGLDADIASNQERLADAKYWQKQYNDSISEAASALKTANDQRATTEERIASLELETQKDRLDIAMQSAETLGDSTTIAAAQAALDAFENEQRAAQMAARTNELATLRAQLPEIIEQQTAAKAAYDAAVVAADASIAAQKAELQAQIDSATAQRTIMLQSIADEQARTAALVAEQAATQSIMAVMGFVRQTELEKLNASIDSLVVRGLALEAERSSLTTLLGVAAQGPDVFTKLAAAIKAANDAAAHAAGAPPTTSVTPTPPGTSTASGGNSGNTSLTGMDLVRALINGNMAAAGGNPSDVVTAAGAGAGAEFHNFRVRLAPGEPAQWMNLDGMHTIADVEAMTGGTVISAFKQGGPTHEGLSYLHDDEWVVPKHGALVKKEGGKAQAPPSFVFESGSVVINAQPGEDAADLGRKFLNWLEMSGDAKARLEQIVKKKR